MENKYTKEHLVNEMGDFYDESLVSRLEEMGFFDAPASTKFHGAYRGGLFDHSFEVMKQLVLLTEQLGLRWQNPRSPYIVGLLHDLCKYDQYDMTLDGRISWNPYQRIKGHGDKSVVLVLDLIPNLTDEEAQCIRWHMGAFDEKEKWKGYTGAVKNYPNVLFTHTADMIASHIIGI